MPRARPSRTALNASSSPVRVSRPFEPPDPLVGEPGHAVPVGARPGSDRLTLHVESETLFGLAVSGDSAIGSEAHDRLQG